MQSLLKRDTDSSAALENPRETESQLIDPLSLIQAYFHEGRPLIYQARDGERDRHSHRFIIIFPMGETKSTLQNPSASFQSP
jgi:hypothetical protein